MEELKKLEQLQGMMTIMESKGVIEPPSNHDNANELDSHRFLTKFALFLMEPCGELSLDDKSRLISDHLPKISATFVDAELKLPCGRNGYDMNSFLLADQVDSKNDCCPSPLESEGMCFIGLDAMQRANSTLEDFCRSYFMFHGMDPNSAKAIFRYLPVLSFTESYIYQLDTLNERMLHTIRGGGAGHDESSNMELNGRFAAKSGNVFESDPLRPLLHLLEQHGLLAERSLQSTLLLLEPCSIREELRCGEEYWALERKLCGGSGNKIQISVLVEDVTRAIHLKSFDYRVLNLLLYALRREEVNELHMNFLSVSELLVEISDDLFDYEEDVLENNFNVLRMFVRLYGTSNASTMLAKYIAEVEEKYDRLLKALDPRLSQKYQIRCEEATSEGGSVSGHPLGSWTIPPLIANEELYRSSYGHQATN